MSKYIHPLPPPSKHTHTHTHFSLFSRRSLSLIESLLQLSEQGHYEEVMNVLHTPMSKCPEILFLGVIKAKVRGCPFNHQIVIKAKVRGGPSNHKN